MSLGAWCIQADPGRPELTVLNYGWYCGQKMWPIRDRILSPERQQGMTGDPGHGDTSRWVIRQGRAERGTGVRAPRETRRGAGAGNHSSARDAEFTRIGAPRC